ncbi:MAG: cytochrome c [Solirubrobacteraceae bacterium]|nr:cytochrome c [Patulibacter sp.]
MPLASVIGSTAGRSAAILASAAAVALFAGCGSGSDSSSSSSGSGGSSSGGATKTITAATDGLGIFKGSGCTSCHTLAAAGSSGNIGPNLDNSKPSEEEAVEKVTNGDGSMPAFKNRLSAAQIQTVAKYVHDVTAK